MDELSAVSSEPAINLNGVSKKFSRTLFSGFRNFLAGIPRKIIQGEKPSPKLHKDEFWAINNLNMTIAKGECVGIIGPNGAGKSTLLKLISRHYRPDIGKIQVKGQLHPLLQLESSLQPQLTGRENIYIKCYEKNLGKQEADQLQNIIADFSGLDKELDKPVKQYSDGMHARLSMAIATAFPTDILLIDELISVSDVLFQVRLMERLEQLKKSGTTILLVSHSESLLRRVTDKCLFLMNGNAMAFGETEQVYHSYHEAIGISNSRWTSLQDHSSNREKPVHGPINIQNISVINAIKSEVTTGKPLQLTLSLDGMYPVQELDLIIQFRNDSGILLASFDSALNGGVPAISDKNEILLSIPFFPLTSGVYRLSGGFKKNGLWLSCQPHLLNLTVIQDIPTDHQGLSILNGSLST